ncbi:hypothetical protein C6380_14305 [Pseudomonas syringae pv. actinidiae]|uniref:hypothetical protein n=1 Tax=Pseudomonas syringae TaxID=317 RepID=UPI000BB59BE6|nr:hypothetical protein [Pseudomonas syringae]PBK49586.1 hypothetical protein BUE61_22600 [Pseudomonas syringae pv. actinidiae]PBK54246.1 hypothetical protein BUE60_10405 [Pseudomonas syringae pv. actinidiae]RJX53468.1 hypothetical protein C6379_17450 [Pseudomonas syringae pv. actinidiae]RJX55586.1 hypothetical protein C6380_14305 [Pseudomonas syringae pv. actinidiae]RJX63854.1 hypothetical protein C6383_05070 [Pseudomonas syringae pv. actinidiae]
MSTNRTTVSDLIRMLSTHHPSTPVLLDGYEDGFDQIERIETAEVVDRAEPESWQGQSYKPCEVGQAGRGTWAALKALTPDIPTGEPYTALIIRGCRGEFRKPE